MYYYFFLIILSNRNIPIGFLFYNDAINNRSFGGITSTCFMLYKNGSGYSIELQFYTSIDSSYKGWLILFTTNDTGFYCYSINKNGNKTKIWEVK